MKITPPNIKVLLPNQILVFGSNMAGRHGKGLAKIACQKFGAEYGVGFGYTGDCYAIPTKDEDLNVLSLDEIAPYLAGLVTEAKCNGDWEYLVTRIGCGLAGYTPQQIAPLLGSITNIPPNMSLPEEFWIVLRDSHVE